MALASRKTAAVPAQETTFLAAIVDETTRETVRAAARQLGWQKPEIREGGVAAATALVKAGGAPAVMVVDISESHDPVIEVAGLIGLCGEAHVIAIGLVNDVRLFRRLREAGVADYLVKPASIEVLQSAIEAAAQTEPKEAAKPKIARTIAFVGARGGVGATSIAVSAGWAMAQTRRKVILLDLDLHFGSAALSLDLEPGRGLLGLLSYPDRIDSLLIEAALLTVGDGFRLLGAEAPLEDMLTHGPEGLTAVIHHLKAASDILLIDLPRSLGPITRQTLELADEIVIVTDLSLAAMRDTQRLLTFLKGVREAGEPFVVANRVGGSGGDVATADFERGIGAKIRHLVPFDRASAAAAAGFAKPLAEVTRNAKTSAALRALAMELAGVETVAAPSLLKRVLRR
jgi:pilus assembly protein CpaE